MTADKLRKVLSLAQQIKKKSYSYWLSLGVFDKGNYQLLRVCVCVLDYSLYSSVILQCEA